MSDNVFDNKDQRRGSEFERLSIHGETMDRADRQELYCSEASVGFLQWERGLVAGGDGKGYFRSKTLVACMSVCKCVRC